MGSSSGSYAGYPSTAIVLLLLLGSYSCAVDATTFSVKNNALNTPGGARFNTVIGNSGAGTILKNAQSFIYKTLSSGPRRTVNMVTLFIEDIDGVAYTIGSGNNNAEIHLSASYVADFAPGDSNALKYEITGVLYHESTHCYQNNFGPSSPQFGGLIEGIADYIRLTAKFPATGWVKNHGGNWYDGYSATAYFLQYVDQKVKKGFVNQLNSKMAGTYNDAFFQQITGQTVDQLFAKYQASF